jgi:hypothetical protein
MQEKTGWLILGLITAIACTLVVLLFFVWKISYYFGLIVAAVLACLFVAFNYRDALLENRSKVLKELAVTLGLSAIYTNLYLYMSVLHMDIIIVLIISGIAGIMVGALVSNLTRSLAYVCVAAVAGLILDVLLTVLPTFFGEDPSWVSYILYPVIHTAALPFIFTIVISFFGVMIGNFFIES